MKADNLLDKRGDVENMICPYCGATLQPIVTVNDEGPVHRADKIMFKMGLFFPHIDVEYRCSCGKFRRHETRTLRDGLVPPMKLCHEFYRKRNLGRWGESQRRQISDGKIR